MRASETSPQWAPGIASWHGLLSSVFTREATRFHAIRDAPDARKPALGQNEFLPLRMRKARVCYDHLAGQMGVRMLDALVARRCLSIQNGKFALSRKGLAFASEFGIDMEEIIQSRRPLCIGCLDWSVRR